MSLYSERRLLDSHFLADLAKGLPGDGLGAARAIPENLADVLRLVRQLPPALSQRLQRPVDALCQEAFVLHAAHLGRGALLVNLVQPVGVEELVQAVDVANPGSSGVRKAMALWVGEGRRNPGACLLRCGRKLNVVVQALAHLVIAVQPNDHRIFSEPGLGFRECLTIKVVEATGNLAGNLQVRHLVLAHGHGVRLVQYDVGGHQHGVAHQTVAHRLLRLLHLPHLVLEGGHPHEPTEWGHHAQEGVQYHHLRYVGLDEDDALLRIDACGQPVEHHLMDVGPDLLCGLALHVREGVDVHGGVDAVVLPLEGDPVLQGAQVVADVQPPGWAHT